MTLINQEKHISAERDEKVFIDAQLDKNTGILTFIRKDYYNDVRSDDSESDNFPNVTVNLSEIKLRIKKTTQSHLNTLKNATNDSNGYITERQTHLFLVEFDNTGEEGVYREYIWDDVQKKFEVIGSTKIDLVPLLEKAKVINDYTNVPISFDSLDPTVISSNLSKELRDDFDSHGHGNITNDGKVGANANYFVYTTTNGVVTSKQKIGQIDTSGKIGSVANKPIITTTSGVLTTGSFEETATNIKENGTQSVGQLNTFARGDHIHPTDSTRAPNNHASSENTYGLSTDSLYGHSKSASATPSDVNLSSGAVGSEVNTFARADHVHKHPTGKSKTGNPTANQTPAFGSTFTVTQFTSNATGHISAATDRTVKIPNTVADGTTAGLSINNYTTAEKTKLNGLDDYLLEILDELILD